jgi:hypothetical protein
MGGIMGANIGGWKWNVVGAWYMATPELAKPGKCGTAM